MSPLDDDLHIGWKSIADAAGLNVLTLRQYQSAGRLSVTPIKLGQAVAMTPAMIEALKASPYIRKPKEKPRQG